MDWQDRVEVKKGNLGEAIVDKFLCEKGFIPYRPINGGAHPFDRLVAAPDKRTVFVADTKSKARRTYYPDTGIDIRHYHDYAMIARKHKMPVFLAFVDEHLGQVYGNFLKALDKPRRILHKGKRLDYPLRHGRQIYWPLEAMQGIAWLTPEQVGELKRLSSRHYRY